MESYVQNFERNQKEFLSTSYILYIELIDFSVCIKMYKILLMEKIMTFLNKKVYALFKTMFM